MKPKFEFVVNTPESIKELGLPVRKTTGSAGYDFVSPEDVVLMPGEVVKVKTNIKAWMPQDLVLLLFVRSSIGIKRGIVLANGTGIIDSDYYGNPDNDGNIIAALRNATDQMQEIRKGEAFMQGIFVKYETTNDDDASGVRMGGIGSTSLDVEIPFKKAVAEVR